MTPNKTRPRRMRLLWPGAIGLLVAGSGLVIIGALDNGTPHDGLTSALTPTSGAREAAVSSTAVPLVQYSAPTRLSIPRIGINTSLSNLTLLRNGDIQVPIGFERPGWYSLGPTPGQVGSAVILGHVTSPSGPAIFSDLHFLKSGSRVNVALANGEEAEFKVISVVTYPRKHFPSTKVYGSHGTAMLQLVSCSGSYNYRNGTYASNVVVYSSLVAIVPPKGAALSLPVGTLR